jgi:cytolysin-activating lysine-acyltransferase
MTIVTDDQTAATDTTSTPPRMQQTVSDVVRRIHAGFGQVVLAMATMPRYRHLPLSDLQSLALAPLLKDRIAIAAAKPKEDDPRQSAVGIAIWASVNEAADASIREQIRAGVFPVRLGPDDWNSGPINWLLDVIAPTEPLAAAVVGSFKQVIKDGELRLHPMVTRHLSPETLKKLGAARIEPSQSAV